MEKNWTVVTINNVEYYTLKEVSRELGYKTQKAFIEKYESVVKVFKGIIAGKFVSIDDFNSLFLVKKEEEIECEAEYLDSELDIPIEIKKKFARKLATVYHPDNGGDINLFLWANRLKKKWENPLHLLGSLMIKVDLMNEEDYLYFMNNECPQEFKEELFSRRGYDIDGTRIF